MTDERKVRKAAGKMQAAVGEWSGNMETGDLVFRVRAVTTPDKVAAKVKELSETDIAGETKSADYDILTYRQTSAHVAKVERNSVRIG